MSTLDSQQSVVHHERAPSQELEETGIPQRAAQCQQHSQVTPECAHVAAGVFLADEFFLPFFSFVLVLWALRGGSASFFFSSRRSLLFAFVLTLLVTGRVSPSTLFLLL